MNTQPDLPLPSPEALAISHRLQQRICQKIDDHGGWIGFDRYMELCLYEPGLGYYVTGNRKFGKAGDFITAPDISPLFSHCLAQQCLEAFEHLPQAQILEFGAGSGNMAADILRYLDRQQALPDRYLILEISPDLQHRQRDALESLPTHLYQRIHWISNWPDAFQGIVLANEVADAFPVHRFEYDGQGLLEWGVSHDESGLHPQTGVPGAELSEAMEVLARHQAHWPAGYQSEYPLFQQGWVRGLAECLQQAVVLLIDYGYSETEYYHPQRSRGTLQCHYRHRSHNDPFFLPGLQDITAHVNFSALARSAAENELALLGYTSQGQFLISAGITDMVQADNDEEAIRTAQQIKQLTLPTAMGESFKVMALGRNANPLLSGFQNRDLRYQL